MFFLQADDYHQWRDHARRLLSAEVPPAEIHWNSDSSQQVLFADPRPLPECSASRKVNVPKAFLEWAEIVACYCSDRRWQLLYRTLWRLTHGERNLLEIVTDDDVHQLGQMKKMVTRDVHKMKAFVRFRKVEAAAPAQEAYVAWHRPDHRIVRLAAPFFSRRFKEMHWTILTPLESVTWNQKELVYGPGVPASEAPQDDALEDLWKTYYASIFNPARIKVSMMKREMPVRHWPTMPETELIPDLLREASQRVDRMVDSTEGFAKTAAHYLPDQKDLASLRSAAQSCRACDLCQHATQAVFGEGRRQASLVLIGEQPGDQEDLEGRPFVGPAGQLLDSALATAGINRDDVYVTNVVKHFKFTEQPLNRGKRRLHKKPNSREIYACRPWLEAELDLIRPQAIVCLGATPAQAIFGRDFRVSHSRGQLLRTDWCNHTIATWHPAALLRMPNAERRAEMLDALIADLASAAAVT